MGMIGKRFVHILMEVADRHGTLKIHVYPPPPASAEGFIFMKGGGGGARRAS